MVYKILQYPPLLILIELFVGLCSIMKFWTAGFFNLTVGDFGYVLSASHIATGGEDTRIRISIALSGGVWIFR